MGGHSLEEGEEEVDRAQVDQVEVEVVVAAGDHLLGVEVVEGVVEVLPWCLAMVEVVVVLRNREEEEVEVEEGEEVGVEELHQALQKIFQLYSPDSVQ